MVGRRPVDEATNLGILQDMYSFDFHNNYCEVSKEGFVHALKYNKHRYLEDYQSAGSSGSSGFVRSSSHSSGQDIELNMEVMGPELQVVLVRRRQGEKCESG
jgi:hypothetical protein